MKFKKIILLFSVLAAAATAQIDTNSNDYYMFFYFIQGDVEQTMGARIAISTDCVTWEKYNDEKVVIKPEIAEGDIPLMRDPNTWYDSTTGTFHLTWTTQWSQTNVGYSSSKDLIHWTDQVMIPVGKKINGCKVCWAPEFIPKGDSIMLYWSVDNGAKCFQPYYSMTKNFRHYTTPKNYFSPKDFDGKPYSIIDETIIKVSEDNYYMFFKDERTNTEAGQIAKNIHFVKAPTPQGPWWVGPAQDVSKPISNTSTEGPTAYIVGDELRVCFDPYLNAANTDRTRKIKVSELTGAEPPAASAFTAGPIMKTFDGKNFTPSHGSVSKIPKAKVLQLLKGIQDPTVYKKKYYAPKQGDMMVGEPGEFPPYVEPIDTVPVVVTKVYPYGKQNMGCGTGVGLALIPPFIIRGISLRRRKKQKGAKVN